jgi:hypothetical protein
MHCIVVESIPSVGLAVVDSMLPRRIKVFGSHAQAFPSKTAAIPARRSSPGGRSRADPPDTGAVPASRGI